jgi:hypothetical protein
MTIASQHLLEAFDLLSAAEKQAVTCEILRRMQDVDFPPLSDEELILSAETLFLELDSREATDALRHSGVM